MTKLTESLSENKISSNVEEVPNNPVRGILFLFYF